MIIAGIVIAVTAIMTADENGNNALDKKAKTFLSSGLVVIAWN